MSVQACDSGITSAHIQKIQEVAKKRRCFIMVRPVNTLATGLIEDNYPVKGLDIHGKSSDWGPQAGFVPWDQSLSKVAGIPEKVKKGNADNKKDIKQKQVEFVPLVITGDRLKQLRDYTIKEKTNAFLSPDAEKGGAFTLIRDSKIQFKLSKCKTGDQYEVLYLKANEKQFEPLEVMGYSEAEPKMVTADYDLFAVCPYYRTISKSSEVTQLKNRGLSGILSQYHMKVIQDINSSCRPKNPVVKHGAELSNPHPQEDKKIVMFTATGTSRMIPNDPATRGRIFADLIKRGFHIYVNKKWDQEVQTAIESRMNLSITPTRLGSLEALKSSDFIGFKCKFDANFVNLYMKNKKPIKIQTFEFKF